ncbi:patatin-like phospholipase family protein [Planococcus lenghuensis]|uniref:Patatin family protein n=1 Tax=Planococcus lenghuensis TaxID=2213202 RepID=A0A1Q2KZ30_9BACL|nr:patatin family protein [Planococcus lenghuensis]AQQ53459.1 patatin family protein [Planococcus lenghuensis]
MNGLILEGGGMRGVYTAGVLEYFMEKNLYLPYVIGVSAGASYATSYLARQPGRNREVSIGYIHHPDYISPRNLLRKRELFGMDLLFDELPNQLVPLDFDALHAAPEQFWITATDCVTGDPLYYDKAELGSDVLSLVRASCSLPFVSPGVIYDGKTLMDGGISDPIPIGKALQDGTDKNIIVLTKSAGHRKKPSRLIRSARLFYKRYPGLTVALEKRWALYNETMERIEEMEREGDVFIFRPTDDHGVTRTERDPVKLEKLYNQGYSDAKRQYAGLETWLES